jgi:hypothetical protein
MEIIPLTIVARMPSALRQRLGEPVTFGMPFPKGLVTSLDGCALIAADGHAGPVQAEVRERWSDGSVRWGLMHGLVDWAGDETRCGLDLAAGAAVRPADTRRRVVAERGLDGAVVVDTGVTRFVCAAGPAFPFARVQNRTGQDLLNATASGLQIVDADGQRGEVVIESVDVEHDGPLCLSIRWRGRLARGPSAHWLDLDARGQFFAGLPTVRLAVTIRNPRAAQHPGNFWELGDTGSAVIREARLVLTLAGSGAIRVQGSVEAEAPLVPFETPFELYQESSGGPLWDSPVHVNRDGRVPMRFPGYRLTSGSAVTTGRRASPVVALTSGDVYVAVAAPGFWQNFPRAIEVRDQAVIVGLWPGQSPDVHELQGGEQKTHDIVLAFDRDPVCETPLDWCRAPALVRADPDWYCSSGVVPYLVPERADSCVEYRTLVRAAIEGNDTFESKREGIDEYGWRNFGDLYADHEAVRASNAAPFVSHYNNQYDAVAGFAVQFFRSADPRWWTLMAELATHVVDIDLYHSLEDRTAYSGGPFWHTCHYVDAGRSTHRSYPQAPGVSGGGPGNEHNYSTGLLLHHFLTGDPRSREAVEQLADWVLRIDDGRRSRLRWLDRGDTGLASATREPGFHGPGRGAANSIAALLDGYRVTGRAIYLDKAECLIRRCIHPDDDIDERGLLDAETRWSYTVFLQVLCRYLEESAERGTRGATYAWARESVLRYARWMALRERPYLDAPEQLEYPTETWAAQDMRKCEVLLRASLLGRDDDERRLLRDRAAFFFHTSLRTLGQMTTRTLVRPVVILLTNGPGLAWFSQSPAARLPEAMDGPHDFGQPATFVPQRARALARARWVLGSVVLVGIAAVLEILLW